VSCPNSPRSLRQTLNRRWLWLESEPGPIFIFLVFILAALVLSSILNAPGAPLPGIDF
jgi:hypothetical protein